MLLLPAERGGAPVEESTNSLKRLVSKARAVVGNAKAPAGAGGVERLQHDLHAGSFGGGGRGGGRHHVELHKFTHADVERLAWIVRHAMVLQGSFVVRRNIKWRATLGRA